MERIVYHMKICFVLPETLVLKKIRHIMETEFSYMNAEYLIYQDYRKAGELLRGRQGEFDAVVFSGRLPYIWSKERIKQETIWSYIPRSGSTLLSTLMKLMQEGYDLQKISFDTLNEDMLKEAFLEMGYDFTPMVFKGDGLDTNYDEEIYEFHRRMLREKKAQIAMTMVYSVEKQLKEDGLPVIFAVPTYNIIREQIQLMERYSKLRKEAAEQVAVMMIAIEYPSEYSIMKESEEHYLEERRKIERRIYQYADRMMGCVVEMSPRSYMILSTKTVMEKETEEYRRIELLEQLDKDSLYTVSIGIGIAVQAAQAKKNAVTAMLWARRHQRSSVYIRFEGGSYIGPVYNMERGKGGREMDSRLNEMAETAQLSVNTLYNIYCFATSQPNRYFTSWELAEGIHISKRSADRILRRLEDCGYVKVVGKRITGKSGRPTRVLRFNITK